MSDSMIQYISARYSFELWEGVLLRCNDGDTFNYYLETYISRLISLYSVRGTI